MKQTKKMIIVHEAEWLIMLNIIRIRPFGQRKVGTEIKIAKVLWDLKLSEGVKAKKYNWLYKYRLQLKKEIAEKGLKPQKIVIDPQQLDAIKSDISKEQGISYKGGFCTF